MTPRLFFSRGRVSPLAAACGLVTAFFAHSSAGLAAPARAVAGEADEPKDHVLFLGLDLFVVDQHRTSRVQRISKDGVEIVEDGFIRTASLRESQNYHVTLEPKVSDFSVTIDRFTEQRTFSPGRDPTAEMMQQQILMDDLRQQQVDRVSQATVARIAAADAMNEPVNTPDADAARQIMEDRQRRLDAASANLNTAESSMYSMGGFNPISDAAVDPNLPHDALDVSFRISSPVVLEDAHAVLVSILRLPSTPPTTIHTVKVEPLPRIAARPRVIHIRQPALPLGYDLLSNQVHIYAGGREIATNLSPRRVELSASEAQQFLIAEYALKHYDEDRPPQVMAGIRPAGDRALISPEMQAQPVTVRVNRDGEVVDVRLIPTGVDATDRYIEDLVRGARFFPALRQGDPVDGEVTLALAAFFQ